MPRILKWIRRLLLLGLVLGVLAALYVAGLFWYASGHLPSLESIESYNPPQISRIYAADGTVLGHFGSQKRTVVPVEEIPPLLLNAFIATEDAAFFQHGGLDFFGIARAAFANILSLSARQGASTISQQLLKNALLSDEPKVIRKVKEAILVDRLESTLTKRQILGLYVNEIYFANGIFGVAEAARFYFSKSLDKLDVGEMAYLAGVINSPGNYALNRHPERAKKRQQHVLRRMLDQEYIDKATFDKFVDAPLVFNPPDDELDAPYAADAARRMAEEQVDAALVKRGGLQIYTSIDPKLQQAAIEAVRDNLLAYDKRHGYRPLKAIDAKQQAVWKDNIAATTQSATRGKDVPVIAYSAEFKPRPLRSDDEENAIEKGESAKGAEAIWHTYARRVKPSRLYFAWVVEPQKDGGLVVDLGVRRGRIGYDNLTWGLGKSPGKAAVAKQFKAGQLVVVSPAFGFDKYLATPDKLLPLKLEQVPEAQSAMIAIDPQSRGVQAIVGGFAYHLSSYNRALMAKRQPGSSFKPFVYLAALKSKRYTPATLIDDEQTTFKIKGGKPYTPHNYDGKFRGPIRLRQALANSVNIPAVKLIADVGPQAAIGVAHAMGIESKLEPHLSLALGAVELGLPELVNAYATIPDEGMTERWHVVTRIKGPDGTLLYQHVPKPVRAISREEAAMMASLMQSVVTEGTSKRAKKLGRPVAGKTGTTNDQIDAWFVGYTPQLAAGFWVGYDDRTPLGRGETGGRAALPGWVQFMLVAHKQKPIKAFPTAPNLVYTWINPETGMRVNGVDPDAVMEVFLPGTEPAGAVVEDTPPQLQDDDANTKKPLE